MVQYIDKDALVAKIDDWRHNITMGIITIPLRGHQRADAAFEYEILGRVRDFLDTLEVKEVDFEKELDRIWFDNKFGDLFDNSAVDYTNVREICKHFFELGMSVGNKAQKGKEI